jgi:hypothetical protein
VAAPAILGAESARRTKPALLLAIALAGCAAAACTVAVDVTSDRLSQPAVHAILLGWIMLPYIFGPTAASAR